MKKYLFIVTLIFFMNVLCIGCSVRAQKEDTILDTDVQTEDYDKNEEKQAETIVEVATEAPMIASTETPMMAPTEAPAETPLPARIEVPQEKFSLDKQIIMEDSSEVGGHITENINYAIYPSNIVETNNFDTNQYVWSERIIDITFPQIYYSNEYGEYDIDFETKINEQLFLQGLENDDSFLLGRDTRGLVEYNMDYIITKANEDILSVQYTGELYSVEDGQNMCYGMTINLNTGEKIDLSEVLVLDHAIITKVKNNELEYVDMAGYELEFIVELVEMFVDDYQSGMLDTYSCYFLEDNIVNLIVPMSWGNSNYIILKVPLEE